MAEKTATIMVRIEPEVKEQAEKIMNKLGIPVSVVINTLYRQIILTNSIPYPLELPTKPLAVADLTQDEFEQRLLKSFQELKSGQSRPAAQILSELKKEYHV